MSEAGICRLSGAALDVVLDLGTQPLGNGFRATDDPREEFFFHLELGFTPGSKLVQLISQPDRDLMFHPEYAFFSGTSAAMQKHFKDLAAGILRDGFANDNSFVVELGCNDGIFLRHFADSKIRHLGVEPSDGVANVAEAQGIDVDRRFFDAAVAGEIVANRGKADVVVAANVMCHIPDIRSVAEGISLLLADDGVLIFEDPYLGDVIRKTSYDQIYDEHVFLFSALSVREIFATVDFELIRAEAQQTHGGSMRYTLARKGRRPIHSSLQEVIAKEQALGLDRVETYHRFASMVAQSAKELRRQLAELVDSGKSVASYGATSKSTTVFNYANIGPELINCVYDNTPIKQGLVTPGMHIPVVSDASFTESPPDVAFLGAWNHEAEIRRRNRLFEANGGRWLSHVPHVGLLT